MTIKHVATQHPEAQTPSPMKIDFHIQILRGRIEQKLEALKIRARDGELVDLSELDALTNLARRFGAYQDKLRREAFGALAPAPSYAKHRGH